MESFLLHFPSKTKQSFLLFNLMKFISYKRQDKQEQLLPLVERIPIIIIVLNKGDIFDNFCFYFLNYLLIQTNYETSTVT